MRRLAKHSRSEPASISSPSTLPRLVPSHLARPFLRSFSYVLVLALSSFSFPFLAILTCWLASSFYTGDSTCGLSTIRTESKIPSAWKYSTDGEAKLYSVGNEVQFSSKHSLRFCTVWRLWSHFEQPIQRVYVDIMIDQIEEIWPMGIIGCVALCCSVLQCVATQCTIFAISLFCNKTKERNSKYSTLYCNTMQHTATRCNTLHHTAPHSAPNT